MRPGSSNRPWWVASLTLSAIGGAVCALLDVGLSEFDGLHAAGWRSALRILACATVCFAAVLFAWMVDEEPQHRPARISRLALVPAGAVGGVAGVLLFEPHPRLELLAVAALVGIVMAVLGVFRLIAQGL
jgi:hypothetical protein